MCTSTHHTDLARMYLKGSEIHGSLGRYPTTSGQGPKACCGHPQGLEKVKEWTIPGPQGWFIKDRPLQAKLCVCQGHSLNLQPGEKLQVAMFIVVVKGEPGEEGSRQGTAFVFDSK